MKTKKPIAIIGAGIAGLTAANFLRRNNIPFILYEAGKKIAGLATSFKDAEGFSYDFGAHFITNRLAEAIGVSSECRLVKHYGEAVWLKGKTYNYPFGLVRIPRMTLSWLTGQIKSIQRQVPDSAAEWFHKRYGSALADEVAVPLAGSLVGCTGRRSVPCRRRWFVRGKYCKNFVPENSPGNSRAVQSPVVTTVRSPRHQMYGMFIQIKAFLLYAKNSPKAWKIRSDLNRRWKRSWLKMRK